MGTRSGLTEPSNRTRLRVSVIVEGYNEAVTNGSVEDTLAALRDQTFPLKEVELILVGSAAQARRWEAAHGGTEPFGRVLAVAADGAHYYALKNLGADAASGDLLALTNSDVRPEPGWLAALVGGLERGADVVCGPGLFARPNDRHQGRALMQAAASVSWGWIVGPILQDGEIAARGFTGHNVGFRAEVLRRHRYRVDLGRLLASTFLFRVLAREGAVIRFQPEQRTVHRFSWGWWLRRLHFRKGYEAVAARQLDSTHPRRWLLRLGLLDPLLTTAWHVVVDLRQWARFSQALGLGWPRRVSLAPVVLVLSLLARAAGLAGMYARLLGSETAALRLARS